MGAPGSTFFSHYLNVVSSLYRCRRLNFVNCIFILLLLENICSPNHRMSSDGGLECAEARYHTHLLIASMGTAIKQH